MPDEQRTVLATTEDLRRILMLIHSTIAYGASAVALTLVGGWVVVAVMSDVDVPTILPLLAIASTLVTIVAWASQEEIQQIGKAYRVTVNEPESHA